jgi:hypothetical protein
MRLLPSVDGRLAGVPHFSNVRERWPLQRNEEDAHVDRRERPTSRIDPVLRERRSTGREHRLRRLARHRSGVRDSLRW